ncbi:MAG: hypothetical protein GY701_32010 [Sulfitobacter sp.]|nr:hypothetical protein [Sulfitobacter sp.]
MSDRLRVGELTPDGGTFSGLLFENPNTGYPLQLSWTFSVDFAEVDRDYGSTRPNVVVDWVQTGDTAWNEMAGARFACATFGEPIETSVYFIEHHRYDRVEVEVSEQRGAELAVRVRAGGDVDSLGIAEIAVDATLTFSGIYVQTDMSGNSVERAAELLSRFTDARGLRGRQRGHNVVFEPAS